MRLLNLFKLAVMCMFFVFCGSYFGVHALRAGLLKNDQFFLCSGSFCLLLSAAFLVFSVFMLGQEWRRSQAWLRRVRQL